MTSTAIEIGSVLADRYSIEAVLGAGGMSTVYRATDLTLGRTVAIKVFRDSLSDAKALERQRAEVTLIASFEHPSLVTLFDAVVLDEAKAGEHAFLVMQFVDGHDLGVELARGPIDENRTVTIGADIADALASVHEQGVIHRDVKPGNILVVAQPRPSGPYALLADFGIARFLDGLALTATGSVLGTANYLSPEQALGRELTGATDVYSLGLVLIEAISGTRAFPGSGMESVAARIGGDPALPPAASDALNSLLRSMTQREPAARPTAAQVRDRLAGISATAELPATVALPVESDATVPMASDEVAAYAPTAVLPAAFPAAEFPGTEPTTTVITDVPAMQETRSVVRYRVIVAAFVVLLALTAVVVAVALPRSTPTTISTPRHTSTAATSTPTPSVAASTVSQTVPTVPAVTPTPPGITKPGKGNHGNGPGNNGNGPGKGPGKKPEPLSRR